MAVNRLWSAAVDSMRPLGAKLENGYDQVLNEPGICHLFQACASPRLARHIGVIGSNASFPSLNQRDLLLVSLTLKHIRTLEFDPFHFERKLVRPFALPPSLTGVTFRLPHNTASPIDINLMVDAVGRLPQLSSCVFQGIDWSNQIDFSPLRGSTSLQVLGTGGFAGGITDRQVLDLLSIPCLTKLATDLPIRLLERLFLSTPLCLTHLRIDAESYYS